VLKTHLEIKALEVVERVRSRQPHEDGHVELKANWPETIDKAARQLAASANAALGEYVTWLIGINEDGSIPGASALELADWLPQVAAKFEGSHTPILVSHVNVSVGQVTVVALLFDTRQPPYLVKNPAFGVAKGESINWEVPWREGGRARTARRADLLSILGPTAMLPECELTDCILGEGNNGGASHLCLTVTMYVVPRVGQRVAIPFRKCEAGIRFSGDEKVIPLRVSRLIAGANEYAAVVHRAPSATIKESATEILIDGPGTIILIAEGGMSATQFAQSNVEVILRMQVVYANAPIIVSTTIRPHQTSRRLPEWRLTATSQSPDGTS
jgi:hypothetical protein